LERNAKEFEKEMMKNGVSELGCNGIRRSSSISDRLVYLRSLGCGNTRHHEVGFSELVDYFVTGRQTNDIAGSISRRSSRGFANAVFINSIFGSCSFAPLKRRYQFFYASLIILYRLPARLE
jgi:hypothetical protein